MPLPAAQPRQAQHSRTISMQGFLRQDGFYEVDAHLVDTKTSVLSVNGGRVVQAGDPIHDMSVRLVFDTDLQVVDVVASIDAAPHPPCPDAVHAMAALKGLRIGKGWSAAVRERLGGALGCTHLMELLTPMATVAFHTLAKVLHARPLALDTNGRPKKIDSCYAYAGNREVVQRLWPQFSIPFQEITK